MESNRDGKRSWLGWLEARVNLTEIVSFLSVFGLLPAELDSRKPLREALREAMAQPLPSYARWPRVLGILSFLLFLFLVATGTMLAFYYQPTAEQAYPSVTLIARDVAFGSLIHQVHYWSAALFLLLLGMRVIRFFFQGLYARGREVVWMAAVLTFVAAAIADLTGRLLPYDASGYWTTVRAREVTDALPVLGPITSFLVGGAGLDSTVLTRYYVLHIAIFPLVLLTLFYLHFSSVRRVGMSRVVEAPPANRSLRVAMYDLLLLVIFMVGGLMTLAVLVPHGFDAVADPFQTPPDARPPWYLLAPLALMEGLAFLPRFLRGVIPEAILAVVVFLPFLDRESGSGSRRQLFRVIGIALLFGWATLTFIGWYLEVKR